MKDFNDDEVGQQYCDSKNCHVCDGTDFSGEPNGYGCPEQEKHIVAKHEEFISLANACKCGTCGKADDEDCEPNSSKCKWISDIDYEKQEQMKERIEEKSW